MKRYANRFFVYYFHRGGFIKLIADISTITRLILISFYLCEYEAEKKGWLAPGSALPQISVASPRFAFQ